MRKKNLSIILLTVLITMGSYGVSAGEPRSPDTDPVNNLFEELSESDRNKNQEWLSAQLKDMTAKEKLSKLLEILKTPSTCFVARPALAALVKENPEMLPELRAVVLGKRFQMTTRSEALAVLVEVGDTDIVDDIEQRDMLKPITAYEDVHAPEYVRFSNNYLKLKMLGLQRAAAISGMVAMLKDPDRTEIARRRLVEQGEHAVPALVRAISKTNTSKLARLGALLALKQIGISSCAGAVLQILKDEEEDDQIRELAAATLGVVGDKGCIPELEAVARLWKADKKSPYDVAKMARQAISAIRKAIQKHKDTPPRDENTKDREK